MVPQLTLKTFGELVATIDDKPVKLFSTIGVHLMECLEMPLCPTHETLCPGTERWDKTTGTEGIASEPYVPHPRHCKTLCPGTERWDTTTGTEGSGQNVSVPIFLFGNLVPALPCL